MTPSGYLQNPSGKGSSFVPTATIRGNLNDQYATLYRDIKARYYIVDDARLICHVGIPSRSVKDLRYDVILEFNIKDLSPEITNISHLQFKCFSNCPSFVYTYAHVFKRNGLLCNWLALKYPVEVMTDKPNTRNSQMIISYERSLYLALKFMVNDGRNRLSFLTKVAEKVNSNQPIIQSIKPFDLVMERYSKATSTKKKEEPDKKSTVSNMVGRKSTHTSKSAISKVKTTKSSGSITKTVAKKTSKTKSTRKI